MTETDYMIYPKQFRSVKIPIEKRYCFFLMPFNEVFDEIYGALKEQLTKIGYTCNRADELTSSKPIINKILVEISKAQYVIVDLTGCNPNVFYELGITHTLKDAQNVLLLKQKDSSVPFDITHLQYHEYNQNNLIQLCSTVKKFITEGRYVSDFYDALNAHGIFQQSHNNQEIFLNYLQQKLRATDIITLTNILYNQSEEYSHKDEENILNTYQSIIYDVINEKKTEILPEILRLYGELLASCKDLDIVEIHINAFLNESFIHYNLSASDIDSYKTDLVVLLAEKRKLSNITLSWMINYFKKSKAATIDLNRYKLESFLMNYNYDEVNDLICNALLDKDCHVREHFADIAGEKRLSMAENNLRIKLINENNFYTARSIIEAMGKIGNVESIRFIFNWLSQNKQEIISTKNYFVFRHAHIAITKLDNTHDMRYVREFNDLYGVYINEETIL
ncbi:hypothetical protein [Candidatus Methanomassiliicoccus intestinalis]|uniref:hypothetical protein n=1 Tax=Candidatus Methanomassiliicoccus intestinalis TaxID=1406512 RepID=UPI0037DC26F0